MSDSPPERDLEWTDSGIEGVWRFVNRLFTLASDPPIALPTPGVSLPNDLSPAAGNALRAIHRSIAAVTEHLEKFRFNSAVAQIYSLANLLRDMEPGDGTAETLRFGIETLVRLVAPMMPHLAEELWERLGHQTMLVDQPWPTADHALLQDDRVTVAVQVNGKLRGTVEQARDADDATAEAAALALPAVQRLLDGKHPRKVIVVRNRVINVVV
jgi:leucyl-tRNA synthetase